jgi:hypothetical protein
MVDRFLCHGQMKKTCCCFPTMAHFSDGNAAAMCEHGQITAAVVALRLS